MIKTYTKNTLTREVLEGGVKLRVIDETHSRAFQRACLDIGARWIYGWNVPNMVNMPYLYVIPWGFGLNIYCSVTEEAFNDDPSTEIYFDDGRASTIHYMQHHKAYIIDFSKQGCIETVIDDGRPAFQRLRELGVLFDSKQDAQRWLDNHIEGEKWLT